MRSVAFVAAVILGVVLFIGVLYAVRAYAPPPTVLASPVPSASATVIATTTPFVKQSAASSLFVTCGVVVENTITFGQGSGPNTYELRSMAGDNIGRFSVAAGTAAPMIGSYVCGRFEGGAPMSGLRSLIQPGEPDYLPPTYVNKTYKFSVVLPEPYRRSDKLSFSGRANGRPAAQDAFTARTPADDAIAAAVTSCETACPIWNYVAVVSVFTGTGGQSPREWYASFGFAKDQVIQDTTVGGRAAIRVKNGVPYQSELVVKDVDRVFLVGYMTYPGFDVPPGASIDRLERILASFKFVP